MDWLQFFLLAGSILSAFWYLHRESSREMKEISEKFSQESKEISNRMAREFKEISERMAQESKDFHGRLCSLEEKYIHMMERFMEDRKR